MSKNPLIADKNNATGALLKKREAKELRFRIYGISAITLSLGFLGLLLFSVVAKGYSAFLETRIKLPITISQQAASSDNYFQPVQEALKKHFPEAKERAEVISLYGLVSHDAEIDLKKMDKADPSLIGKTSEIWLKASSEADMYYKGSTSARLNDKQIKWLEALKKEGRVRKFFSSGFFTRGDSRAPERSGILSSLIGSIFTIICCMSAAFPLGLMTAVYLEEFGKKSRFSEILEVNINNLAAVPSIMFGLLGLAVYINFFWLPRSSSIVGGLTLALLILPIIVITTRNSLRAVPQSIRDAAIALGASKMQATLHHTIPLAMPGIMTGTILGVSRAMGETAPLLMIGMVAFIADVPNNIFSPATALPVQIFLWSNSPEAGFAERASAAIMVLLLFLVMINSTAILLRKKFEVKWT
jgi:phosphate transport system permease protein